MQFQVPQSEAHERIRFTVTTPQGMSRTAFSTECKLHDVEIPEGVDECEVEVVAQFLDGGSRPVGDEMVMKSAEPPQPKPELETKDEEAPESVSPEVGEGMVEDAPAESDDVVEDAPEPVVEEPVVEVQKEVKKPRRRKSR